MPRNDPELSSKLSRTERTFAAAKITMPIDAKTQESTTESPVRLN